MTHNVIIAGAGPVGLTLALMLHERGIEVSVFEAVRDIRPLGVGINLLPHSVRVLDGLGLTRGLDDIAVRTSSLHFYNKFGQLIWSEPRGRDAGYAYPQYSVHRGQFQALLLNEVKARLGSHAVRTDHALTEWQDHGEGGGVTARFRSSDGTVKSVAGSCLVAADGINSTARRSLYPDEGAPIYGGRILWRGTSIVPAFLDGRTMFMAGYQDRKFVAYPISGTEDGACLVNWIAELARPDIEPQLQDWNRQVDVSEFRDQFADWRFDWIDIPALIDSARSVYEFPLSDRDPLPRWTHGNMTLIGDAAHPMYPIGSNGASQGILDAEALTNQLATEMPVADAFASYEAERRPATAQIVLSNRQNGPEQVMQIAEERAPHGFDDIESVIPMIEREEIAARYKQTAGFSVDTVNRDDPG